MNWTSHADTLLDDVDFAHRVRPDWTLNKNGPNTGGRSEDYPKGVWVEKQYRAAILDLERTDGTPVTVERRRTTSSGRAPRGLKLGDVVKFG